MTITVTCSKTGATVGDATTWTIALFNNVVAALHDADSNFGGATDAITGDATAKTVQAVTRTIASADISDGAMVTGTIKPTDSTLGTDDIVLLGLVISYEKKVTPV